MSPRPNPPPNCHASDTLSWEKVLDLLDPTRPIDKFSIESVDSAGHVGKKVSFSRYWEPGYKSGCAVWIKQYEQAGIDLRAFNTAEYQVLQRSLKGLDDCCYEMLAGLYKNTNLVNDEVTTPNSYIAITHMGPTVFDWWAWPVRIRRDAAPLPNLFTLPGNFLRLALAGLKTLQKIHGRGLVHLDFRPPNFCLAGRHQWVPISGEECLQVQLDWDFLKAIDFGFSINRARTPYTLLPVLEQASEATRTLITDIASAGREAFNRLSPAERAAYDADTFDQVRYRSEFWDRTCPRQLDQLCRIDWREDYYQFGKALQAIRDHAQLEQQIGQEIFHQDVEYAICNLPEELLSHAEHLQEFPDIGNEAARSASSAQYTRVASCRIPDDCIDSKRYPLFMAREVMKQLIDNLCVTTAVKPGALS